MITAVSPYIATALFSPPAIIRFYQDINTSIPNDLPYDFESSKKREITFMSDMIIKINSNYYSGFEYTTCLYNNCKDDAILRYKQVYKADYYNIEPLKPFLNAIKTIVYNLRCIPRFSFYPDGAKAVFIFREQEITVEYDFDEPASAFVSKFIGDVLHIRDTTIDNLSQALGAFL